MVDLRLGETSDEDKVTVPGSLEDLTRGQFRNVELFVGIAHIPIAGDHLVVQHRH